MPEDPAGELVGAVPRDEALFALARVKSRRKLASEARRKGRVSISGVSLFGGRGAIVLVGTGVRGCSRSAARVTGRGAVLGFRCAKAAAAGRQTERKIFRLLSQVRVYFGGATRVRVKGSVWVSGEVEDTKHSRSAYMDAINQFEGYVSRIPWWHARMYDHGDVIDRNLRRISAY